MQQGFEQSGIWRSTLAYRENDQYAREREQLRNAFHSFRKNAEVLTGRITKALPNLTKHDISHLDALWETGTLIAGDSYSLNPLEGFVFGGAILLHDAALCFEAFTGGIDEIRNTIVWKDAYAAELAVVPHPPDNEVKFRADFSALRSLHAAQAAKLTERVWLDPDTGEQLFLIEDSSLRKHLGQLIGKIASSHHWDIEVVGSEFGGQVNALPPFPREWRIDPLKLACLLRCADAAHIDHNRAPDFLYALLHLRGLSFNHWQAQNRIARADLDTSDKSGSTLIFTSTRSFPVTDSASWWIAYDAACLIDKEIRASNAILEMHDKGGSSTVFQVKRVKGVESPERMAEYIKTEGWQPCSAMLHVSNIEKLISSLGGEKLYGENADKLGIGIRELIQNARDAVHARRAIDSDFEGCIRILLRRDSAGTQLSVQDNGIGMSRRVLTGPLLDFGSSFWTSSLAREEFPGLRSSKFHSIGQFGIGFYSVFMIAKHVRVTTRRWDEGQNSVNQLIFDNGLTLRPLLVTEKPRDFRSDLSTEITLILKDGSIPEDKRIEIQRNTLHGKDFRIQFKDYLAVLCAGLDVKIFFSENDATESEIHSGHPLDEKFHVDWLRIIAFSSYQEPDVNKYIEENWRRLRAIQENGAYYGLAAVSTRPVDIQDFLSVSTVGGLATSVNGRGPGNYIGQIDYQPKSARREQGEFSASDSVMHAWAREQLDILIQSKISPIEQCMGAAALASFKVDPSPIFRLQVIFDSKIFLLNLNEIAELVEKMDLTILKHPRIDFAHPATVIPYRQDRAFIMPVGSGHFYNAVLDAGIPKEKYSALGCINRMLIARGKSPRWTIEERVIGTPLLGMVDAVVVSVRPI